MFVRFTVLSQDSHFGQLQGIFQALYELLNNGRLQSYEEDWFRRTTRWFDENLMAPTRFSRGKHREAMCWFRDSATRHIEQA